LFFRLLFTGGSPCEHSNGPRAAHLSDTREPYSLDGLLAYAALVTLLAVPGIVLASTPGVLTAALLDRPLGLV